MVFAQREGGVRSYPIPATGNADVLFAGTENAIEIGWIIGRREDMVVKAA